MNKLKIISLTASMVLAMVFTFSCSSDDVNEGGSSSSGGGGNLPGSSSDGGNGGGEEKYSYCIKNGFCHEGPYTLESCSSFGGMPSNNCPNGGGGGSSSSGGEAGNSFSYCLINGQCFSGPFTSKECGDLGGLPNNSCNGGGDKGNDGTPVEYEGKTYKTVNIGTQTWFAENLNYDVEGGKCFGEGSPVLIDYDENYNPITKTLSPAEVQANCNKYGRLYDWSTAMALPSSCNDDSCSGQIQSKHRGICPAGWHIPSNDNWDVLMDYVGGYETAGKHLKAQSGWNPYSGIEDLDTYGFSALPGGYGSSGGSFDYVGYNGTWWSASEYEYNSFLAYGRIMGYSYDDAYWDDSGKSILRSVRCLQD